MKNKKRLIARIGAVIAVLLMVGALAVPCFADTYTPPYGDAISDFNSIIDPRGSNLAFLNLLDWYEGFGDARFFDYKTLVTGEMDIVYRERDFSWLNTHWSSDSGTFQSSMPVDYFSIYAFLNDEEYILDTPAVSATGNTAHLMIRLTKGQTYEEGLMTVQFTIDGNTMQSFGCLYDLTFESYRITGVLRSVYFGNVYYDPSILYDVSIAFTPTQISENIPLAMFVNSLFSSTYSSAVYKNFIYSPYDFYQGYLKSYNLGYDDGERYGYQDAYNDGFADGESSVNIAQKEEVAYNNGYHQGLISTTAYQQGYDQARQQITTGEFGSNFLSGIFTAPLDALREFTIVSWTTADNNVISINLMQILSGIVGLSLFIWFLKMFAGG